MTSRLTPLFVPAAVAAGHGLGYAVAHPDRAARAAALVGHAHLAPLAAVGLLGALLGLGLVAHERRLGQHVGPRLGVLVQAAVAGFWLVEVVERLAHDRLGTLLDEPGLWWGLAFQVVTSVGLVALSRLAVAAGAALSPRGVVVATARPHPHRGGRPPSVGVWGPRWQARTTARRRGPPLPVG